MTFAPRSVSIAPSSSPISTWSRRDPSTAKSRGVPTSSTVTKSSSPPTGASGSMRLASSPSSEVASASAAARRASAALTRSARSDVPAIAASSSAWAAARSSSVAFFTRPCRCPICFDSAFCSLRSAPNDVSAARRSSSASSSRSTTDGSSPRRRWLSRTRSGSSRRSLRSITGPSLRRGHAGRPGGSRCARPRGRARCRPRAARARRAPRCRHRPDPMIARRRICSNCACAAICWANSAVWMPWKRPSSQPTSWACAMRSSESDGTRSSVNGSESRSSSSTSSGASPCSSSAIERRWMSRSRVREASSSGAVRTSSSSCLIMLPIRITFAGCSTRSATEPSERSSSSRRRGQEAERLTVGTDDHDALARRPAAVPSAGARGGGSCVSVMRPSHHRAARAVEGRWARSVRC